jgi:ribulose-phosphate 3-epimerase
MKVGMAIKPKTTVQEVAHLLSSLDYILVMTVEPGFGGQKLMVDCINKV